MSDIDQEKTVSVGCPFSFYRGRNVSDISSCDGVMTRPYCICAKCEVPIPPQGRTVGVISPPESGHVVGKRIYTLG